MGFKKGSMENLVDYHLFNNIYKDKTVLITGHTGFKGSWLSLWIEKMGARVIGYSLKPNTDPNHIELLDFNINSVIGDIRDLRHLRYVVQHYQPDIIFHLAAQSLVRLSYADPIETYETNVLGTLNVFEAARNCASVKAIVNVTSDKCYENLEKEYSYKEEDRMGGYDPYSSSKGCAELLTTSYRNSYFNLKDFGIQHSILLASARAGNVIGGGDWSADRLIPDIVKATNEGKKVIIRSPKSVRPWQHVLEPLSGYLCLGQELLEKNTDFASAWNFGPSLEIVPVIEILKKSKKYWDKIEFDIKEDEKSLHEAKLLMLDCSKALKYLHWEGIWDIEKTVEKTINWYQNFYDNKKIESWNDLLTYVDDAKKMNQSWTI